MCEKYRYFYIFGDRCHRCHTFTFYNSHRSASIDFPDESKKHVVIFGCVIYKKEYENKKDKTIGHRALC